MTLLVLPTRTPKITAPFSDVDPEDVMVGRQVIVKTQSTRVAGVIGSGTDVYNNTNTSSPAETFTLGFTLTWETLYDLEVCIWDNAGSGNKVCSAWLEYKPSQPPTLTALAVADLADPRFSISWHYVSPGGKAAAWKRVRVFESGSDEALYDSGYLADATATGFDVTFRLPGDILPTADPASYDIEVASVDVDGLETTLTATFGPTAFTAPAAPTGFTVTVDETTGYITLAWDSSTDPYYYVANVSRRRPVGDYDLVAVLAAETTWIDREAGVGANDYRLTFSNGVQESDAANLSVTIVGNGHWWHRDPFGELTFELLRVLTGVQTSSPLDQVVLDPLPGEDGSVQLPIVITGQLRGIRGTLPMQVAPEDRDLVDALRAASATLPYSIIASPFGEVWRVRLGAVSATSLPAGHQSVQVPITQVAGG